MSATGNSVRRPFADGALVETVGPSWSSEKLRSEMGGVSEHALHQLVQRGSLLALPTSDGAEVYPIFQFVKHSGGVEVLPGMRAMFTILRGQDPWTVAVAMQTAAPELQGLTPLEWERFGGDQAALVNLAETLLREWVGGR